MQREAALQARLGRARELLETARHAALATVNDDGLPHNSPVFMAFDEQLRAIWASNPQAQHSQNVVRSGQVFIVLFDALGEGGGLYIRASAEAVPDDKVASALETFNVARQRLLRETLTPDYFTGTAPQRLYRAVPEKLWVNLADRDSAGHVIRDARFEVSLDQLRLGRNRTII